MLDFTPVAAADKYQLLTTVASKMPQAGGGLIMQMAPADGVDYLGVKAPWLR